MANYLRNFIFLIITISLLSCSSETIDNQFVYAQDSEYNIPLTRSGYSQHQYDTLPNPYRLSVMQKVYDDYSLTPIELEPTDLYVRFMPRDTVQMRILTKDYNLELFEYPMNIVLQEGDEYINPDIPETDFAWVYTTVKPDFDFPSDIPYIILQECYIPQVGEVIVNTKGSEIDVEAAAFESLGYGDDYIDVLTKSTNSPSGMIQFQDSIKIDDSKEVISRPLRGEDTLPQYRQMGHNIYR